MLHDKVCDSRFEVRFQLRHGQCKNTQLNAPSSSLDFDVLIFYRFWNKKLYEDNYYHVGLSYVHLPNKVYILSIEKGTNMFFCWNICHSPALPFNWIRHHLQRQNSNENRNLTAVIHILFFIYWIAQSHRVMHWRVYAI